MIKTIAAVNTGITDGEDKNYISTVIDGVLFPWTGAANEVMDKKGTMGVAIGYGLIGLIVGSKVTRGRLNSDPSAEPMLGFLF